MNDVQKTLKTVEKKRIIFYNSGVNVPVNSEEETGYSTLAGIVVW